MAERALATAFVNIVPGTKDLESYLKGKLNDDVGTAGDNAGKHFGGKFSGGMTGALVGLGAAFSIAAIGNFAGDLIKSAEEGQRVDATLQQVTKSMNLFGAENDHVVDRLKNYATEMMKRTGIDDDVIKSTQAQLMSFKDLAASADEAGGMFDRATEISADMAAVFGGDAAGNAVKLGKALNDPVGGISALSKVGVQFTDDQKAMIQSMVDAGDVAGAQGLIMTELESQVGGAAAASATAGDKFKASWDDAMQGLGTAIMPVFDKMVGVINDNVLPAVEGFVQWATDNKDAIAAPFENAYNIVKNLFDFIITNKDWLTPLAVAIGIVAGALAIWNGAVVLATAVQGAWNAVMALNPIGLIIIAIAGLVAGLVWFFTQTELGQQIWQGFIDFLSAAWTWLWESILKPVFDAIGAIFTWLYETIIVPIIQGIAIYFAIWGAIFTWLWENVVQPVMNAIGDIFNWLWENVISPVVDWISDALDLMGKGFQLAYDWYIEPAINAIGDIINWVWDNVIKPVFKFVGDAAEGLGKTFKDAFDGLGSWFKNLWLDMARFLRDPINTMIDIINGAIDAINSIRVDIPEWARGFFGGATSFSLNIGKLDKIPAFADGGFVTGPTTALIGEAGPEVVTPLKDFERMMGLDGARGSTVNYYAAPNQSLDSEQALTVAIQRAKVLAAW